VRDGKDVCKISITVNSVDVAGNYVEEKDNLFSHFEAEWCLTGEHNSQRIDGCKNCIKEDEAYKIAVNSILQHYGPGYTVEG
jgi:hypothetical protein